MYIQVKTRCGFCEIAHTISVRIWMFAVVKRREENRGRDREEMLHLSSVGSLHRIFWKWLRLERTLAEKRGSAFAAFTGINVNSARRADSVLFSLSALIRFQNNVQFYTIFLHCSLFLSRPVNSFSLLLYPIFFVIKMELKCLRIHTI